MFGMECKIAKSAVFFLLLKEKKRKKKNAPTVIFAEACEIRQCHPIAWTHSSPPQVPACLSSEPSARWPSRPCSAPRGAAASLWHWLCATSASPLGRWRPTPASTPCPSQKQTTRRCSSQVCWNLTAYARTGPAAFFFFFLILHDSQCVEKSCGWEHNVLWWDSTPAGFITSLQWRQRAVSVENKRVGGERLASFLKHALLLSYFSLHGNQQWWLWAAAHFKARSLLWWLSVSLLVLQVVWVSSGWGSPNSWGKTSSSVCSLVTHA